MSWPFGAIIVDIVVWIVAAALLFGIVAYFIGVGRRPAVTAHERPYAPRRPRAKRDSAEQARADALESELFDPDSLLFAWHEREERTDLYQASIGSPLVTTMLDGFGAPADWPQAYGRSRSESLFDALQRLSRTWNAYYVQQHRDIDAELAWVRAIEPWRLRVELLEEFALRPADEGGPAFLGLYAETLADQVLFTHVPGQYFRISLFGRFRGELLDELRRAEPSRGTWTPTPIEIDYRLDGIGWASCTVRAGDARCELTASYLSDALGDLVRAANAMATGAPRALAEFLEEPGLYSWSLERAGSAGEMSLTVREGAAPSRDRPDPEGALLLSCNSTVLDFARAVERAATAVLTEYGAAGYRAKWVEYAFPLRELESLRAAIAKQSA